MNTIKQLQDQLSKRHLKLKTSYFRDKALKVYNWRVSLYNANNQKLVTTEASSLKEAIAASLQYYDNSLS